MSSCGYYWLNNGVMVIPEYGVNYWNDYGVNWIRMEIKSDKKE
jgi:hypothetical protein